jgi:GxxExxY protein
MPTERDSGRKKPSALGWNSAQWGAPMPINCPFSIRPLEDAEFDEIDERVMANAYAAQNKLGRLCDEHVYENDVAARLRAEGIVGVHTQVPLVVTHRDFSKRYRLDLVVDDMVYELKVADELGAADDAQVYHYAALLETDRIKLLNFGAASIESLLRRCPFRGANRRDVTLDFSRWVPVSERCQALASDAEACLRDWGGFLDAKLFEEALQWFNGGEAACEQRLPVTRDGIRLGSHRVATHSDEVAFVVTSFGRGVTSHENELRCLLELLPIRAWQWINIHRMEMRFVTLTK